MLPWRACAPHAAAPHQRQPATARCAPHAHAAPHAAAPHLRQPVLQPREQLLRLGRHKVVLDGPEVRVHGGIDALGPLGLWPALMAHTAPWALLLHAGAHAAMAQGLWALRAAPTFGCMRVHAAHRWPRGTQGKLCRGVRCCTCGVAAVPAPAASPHVPARPRCLARSPLLLMMPKLMPLALAVQGRPTRRRRCRACGWGACGGGEGAVHAAAAGARAAWRAGWRCARACVPYGIHMRHAVVHGAWRVRWVCCGAGAARVQQRGRGCTGALLCMRAARSAHLSCASAGCVLYHLRGVRHGVGRRRARVRNACNHAAHQ